MKSRRKQVSWRAHPMMWVLGCIDAQGAIVANATKEGRTHRLEESRGKRWRWCVWSQEFIFAGPATKAEVNQPPEPLNDEENFAVCDWLIRHGYADDRCLPAR